MASELERLVVQERPLRADVADFQCSESAANSKNDKTISCYHIAFIESVDEI